MNIDISNAHCGFRTLSVTHAWPRVARHSNPPGRRHHTLADGRAWTRAAGGRAHPRPIGGGVSSRFAKRNARRPRRWRSPRGFADPARRFHSSSSARTVVSSRAAAPRGRRRRRWRTGAGGGARRTIERCRRRPRARGLALVGANCLRARAPPRRPRAARRRPRANRLRDLGSGETTRRI
jgi:hypothetical protein